MTALIILSGCEKKQESNKTNIEKKKSTTSQKTKVTTSSSEKDHLSFTNEELVAIVYIENYMYNNNNKNMDIKTAINDILQQPQFMISESSGTYIANQSINLDIKEVSSKATILASKVYTENFIGNNFLSNKDYSIDELTNKYRPYHDSVIRIVQLSQKNTQSINWSNNEQDKEVINTFCSLLGGRFVSTDPNDYTASYLIGSPYYQWRYEESTNVLITAKIIGRMNDSTTDNTKFKLRDEDTGKEFTLTLSRNVDWDGYNLKGETPIGTIDKYYVDVNSNKNTLDNDADVENREETKNTSLNGDDTLQGDTGSDASNPFN